MVWPGQGAELSTDLVKLLCQRDIIDENKTVLDHNQLGCLPDNWDSVRCNSRGLGRRDLLSLTIRKEFRGHIY